MGLAQLAQLPAVAGDAQARLERGAALLGRRIEQLGGLPPESRSQRLARHATNLAGLSEASAIAHEVVRAACDVAEMQSAMLLVGERGTLQLGAVHGPHGQSLAALDAETRETIAGWVGSATSVYSIGEALGRGFARHETLRAAGAAAILAVPVHVPGERHGLLLLVDRQSIALDTEDVELIELLAAQTGSALQTAAAIEELHDRAARDPLTELGHHGTFLDALAGACEAEPPPPFALLVIDVDGFKGVNDRLGHRAGDELLVRCAGAQSLRTAVAEEGGPTVSVGVAVHRPGVSHATLFSLADRALYDAKRGGRDAVALA
jgi:GGDEF domain-containing protein